MPADVLVIIVVGSAGTAIARKRIKFHPRRLSIGPRRLFDTPNSRHKLPRCKVMDSFKQNALKRLQRKCLPECCKAYDNIEIRRCGICNAQVAVVDARNFRITAAGAATANLIAAVSAESKSPLRTFATLRAIAASLCALACVQLTQARMRGRRKSALPDGVFFQLRSPHRRSADGASDSLKGEILCWVSVVFFL